MKLNQVAMIIAFAIVSLLAPEMAQAQVDLPTRVNTLETAVFGGPKSNTTVPYTNISSAISGGLVGTLPVFSGIGSNTLSWTAGIVNQGGYAVTVAAGTSAVDSSESSCQAPAYSSCDFFYSTGGVSTSISKTTSFATAYGAGSANIIMAEVTTNSAGNILTIVTPPQLPHTLVSFPGTSGGIPYFSAANGISSSAALTANAVVLGGGAGTTPSTVGGLSTDGSSNFIAGVAGASVGGIKFNNATSGTITVNPPTGALGTPTVTLPALTGSLPTVYACGTIAAAGACANTATAGTAHAIFGIATLASNTSTITGISPAFTSSSTFQCVANDITTRANPVQAIPASGSTVTFTNTTGATDNISFMCIGY